MRDKRVHMIASAVAAAAALAFLSGCSGPTKEKMLRIFFDEPPAAKKATPAERSRQARLDSLLAHRKFDVKKYVLHPPYAEKDCGVCHALGASKSFTAPVGGADEDAGEKHEKRLIMSTDELCFECHDDKKEEELAKQAELVHGPTAAGECVECHDPHKSRFKFLLRKADPISRLCFTCHDREDVLSADAHTDLEGEECTECHNPHAGGEYLLR